MNVFDIIPSDFFNYLGGNSNNRVYADCLELIHNQYDKEIFPFFITTRICSNLTVFAISPLSIFHTS